MKTETLALYLTRGGKIAALVQKRTFGANAVSYGFSGTAGAASSPNYDNFLKSLKSALRGKKGIMLEQGRDIAEIGAAKPNPVKPRKAFMSRCMKTEKTKFPRSRQRVAVCISKNMKKNSPPKDLRTEMNDIARLIVNDWWRQAVKNPYGRFYLWYRRPVKGERMSLPIASIDRPNDQYIKSIAISNAWTRDKAQMKIADEMMRLPLLPGDDIKSNPARSRSRPWHVHFRDRRNRVWFLKSKPTARRLHFTAHPGSAARLTPSAARSAVKTLAGGKLAGKGSFWAEPSTLAEFGR